MLQFIVFWQFLLNGYIVHATSYIYFSSFGLQGFLVMLLTLTVINQTV